jgi:hypothetical protein
VLNKINNRKVMPMCRGSIMRHAEGVSDRLLVAWFPERSRSEELSIPTTARRARGCVVYGSKMQNRLDPRSGP